MQLISSLSAVAKTFVLMQLRGKSRKVWNIKEKEFAISFYYKSPATYLFLKRKGLILPSVSSIRRWISQNLFKTGVDDGIKRHLKLKASTLSKNDRKCIIAFDEMIIKQFLEYNSKLDIIERFQDLGPLGRSPKAATHALVFSARGLYKNWKCPISYFFHKVQSPKII